MRGPSVAGMIIALSGILAGIPVQAGAYDHELEADERWWLEGGFGGASVSTHGPGLARSRGAAVLSGAIGYRPTPDVGIGFEYVSSASLSSCVQWDCDGNTWDFKPNFNRASLFGEVRMLDGRVRLRFGIGDNSYCYAGGYGFDLWYLMVVATVEDDELVHSGCSARHGLVRTISVSYHWHWLDEDGPITAGLRLGIERGDFKAKPGIDLPAFRYSALTLTLQLSLN